MGAANGESPVRRSSVSQEHSTLLMGNPYEEVRFGEQTPTSPQMPRSSQAWEKVRDMVAEKFSTNVQTVTAEVARSSETVGMRVGDLTMPFANCGNQAEEAVNIVALNAIMAKEKAVTATKTVITKLEQTHEAASHAAERTQEVYASVGSTSREIASTVVETGEAYRTSSKETGDALLQTVSTTARDASEFVRSRPEAAKRASAEAAETAAVTVTSVQQQVAELPVAAATFAGEKAALTKVVLQEQLDAAAEQVVIAKRSTLTWIDSTVSTFLESYLPTPPAEPPLKMPTLEEPSPYVLCD